MSETQRPLGDRPLPLLSAAREVFALSFEGLVWSGRSVLMAVLLGLPLLFAVAYRPT